MKVNIKEIQFDPASFADPNGRVFHWKGGIYRGISAQAAPLYRGLLRQEHVSRLFEAGLVETEISPLEVEGYEFVLKHQKIPFRSYGFEWCTAMFRDATLLIIDLSIELARLGLELQDAHPYNILFDGSRPIYVDFGSIVPIEGRESWRPAREFMTRFLNPLYLMSKGYADQQRTLRPDSTCGHTVLCAEKQDIAASLNWRQRITWLQERLLRALKYKWGSDRMRTLMRLREIVQAIDVNLPRKQTIYGRDSLSAIHDPEPEARKRRQVIDIVDRCRPKTLLNVTGGDSRELAKAAVNTSYTTVVFDLNEHNIQNLYREASRNSYSVLPLLMDFCSPTPAYGIRNECPPATERFKCEMVLSLAAVHRLVFKQGLRFQEIARALAAFSERFLLVEFVPRQDLDGSEWQSAGFEWYHCQGFIGALEKHFGAIEAIPSYPLPGTLLLCKR